MLPHLPVPSRVQPRVLPEPNIRNQPETRRVVCLLQRDAPSLCCPCVTVVTIVTASHFTLMTAMYSVHMLSVTTHFNIIFTILSL